MSGNEAEKLDNIYPLEEKDTFTEVETRDGISDEGYLAWCDLQDKITAEIKKNKVLGFMNPDER